MKLANATKSALKDGPEDRQHRSFPVQSYMHQETDVLTVEVQDYKVEYCYLCIMVYL